MNAPVVVPDPQVLASDPKTSVFVTANAGSGKTTTLVARVARLLRRGAAPGAVLCVTYTKAAAAEMQRRLFETLGRWSVMADEDLRAELAKLEAAAPGDFDARALAEARALFARALETPGGLKIQTIHAFCEKLLRRFPLEAGVSPAFTVLEDSAAAELCAAAREAVALEALKDEDGPVGRAYAWFAVELDPGRFDELFACFEAWRADLAAYVDAAAQGRAPSPWAACGLPEGATPQEVEAEVVGAVDRDLWRRVLDACLGGSANDQKQAERMAAVDFDAPGAFEAVRAVFCTDKGDPRKSLGTKAVPRDLVDRLITEQERFCAAVERVRAARVVRDTVHALTLARTYAAVYEVLKTQRRGLDFSDLVSRTLDLLTRRADAAWVLYKLDGGVEHVLVDEAQDTAPEQWDIVRALTEEFFAVRPDEARPRTVFAVGDEKQSIYAFQGARPERLLAETRAYLDRIGEAGGRAIQAPLETSWRSTAQVLRFVDAAFGAPELARALTPDRGDLPVHKLARTGQDGSVEMWDPPYRDEAVPELDAWTAPVDAEPAESARRRLARRIAAEIKAAVARGDGVWVKGEAHKRPCGYGDWLILVRRRDALFEEIIRALKLSGVPVAGADRLRLSEHAAFEDLLALGRFVLHPNDDLTLAELLRSPFCDVDEDGLFALARGREGSLWGALNARAEERPPWAAARAFLQACRAEAETRAPFELFSRALNRLDAEGRSMRARLLTRLGREAEEAIDETLARVLAAESRGLHDLESVVADLERAEVEIKRELEGPRGEVRIMTVHGAKGLEAPIVVLPDTTVRAKPMGAALLRTEAGGFLYAARKGDDCAASSGARTWRERRTDEESLRLLYVGLTRARDRLILCGRVSATRDPEEGSWWDVCRRAFDHPAIAEDVRRLDGAEPGETVLRLGPDPEPVVPEAGDALVAPAEVPAWLRLAAAPERAARWTSPSGLGSPKDAAASPLAAAGAGLGRFRRGTLIHKLFEVLPDIDPQARRDAAARLLSRERDLTEAQRLEIAEAAFGVLDDPRFAEVFGPGSRAEAAVAGSSPELPEGVAISGRLDRLVIGTERVLVVDYKTNRPAPDRAEDADFGHLAQMAAYVAVLRRIYPARRVEAALVWTDGPKLTPLSDALVADTLARLREA